MATKWTSPVWRMPENSNQSKLDNYSLDFSATNDYIDLTPEVQFGPNSTISLWYKKDVANANYNLIGSTNSYGYTLFVVDYKLYMYFSTQNNIYDTGPTSGVNTLRTTDWVHIAVVRFETNDPGDSVKLYINGTNVVTFSDTIGAHTTLSKASRLGAESDGTNNFAGKMSQCALFDYSLSETQVKYLYNNNAGGSTPNPQNPMAIAGPTPIAYYPLGGSSTGSSSTLTIPNESDNGDTVFNFNNNPSIAFSDNLFTPSGTVGGAGNFMQVCSISWWMKVDSSRAGSYLAIIPLSNANYWVLRIGPAGNMFFVAGSGGNYVKFNNVTNNSINFYDSKWHHCMFTIPNDNNKNECKFFIDNQQITNTTTAGGTTGVGSPAIMSRLHLGGGHAGLINGTEISNLQVWLDTALNDTEIAKVYNGGRPYTGAQPQAANLKGWWKMNIDTANYINSPQNLTFTPDYWAIDRANITPGATEALNFSGGYQNLPFGSYEGIDFNDTPLTNNKFIMSCWYNCTKPSNDNGYIYHNYSGGTYRISFNTAQINVYANPATVGSHMVNYNLPATRTGWHHLVIYMNQGSGPTVDLSNTNNLKIYIDGNEVSVASVYGDVTAAPVRTEANRLGIDGGGNFEGFQWSNWALLVGDNAVLSAVPTLYNGGTPGDISSLNPTWWYKLNSSNTSFPTSTPPTAADNVFTLTDSSGNGNTTTGPFYFAKNPSNRKPSIQTVNVDADQGISSGMTTANLVTSDLERSLLYSSYSMDFDGTDYIEVSDVSSISTNTKGSISFWLNFAGDTSTRYALGISDTNADTFLTIGIDTSENLDIILRNTGSNLWRLTTTGSPITLNTWQHICLTQDGTACEIYINGVKPTQSGAGTQWLNNLTGLDLLTIGALYKNSGLVNPIQGKISNVSVFNKALSENDILTIYNGGAPNDISSLSPVGWWSLSGDSYFATNWICPDLSANSNNGTSNGTPVTALVGNAPGSTSNGTGTSMAIPTNLQGDAPNSDKNAISVNMIATNRDTSVPSVS